MIAAHSGMWAVVTYVAAISIPLLTLTYFDVPRVALYGVATVAALRNPVRICTHSVGLILARPENTAVRP